MNTLNIIVVASAVVVLLMLWVAVGLRHLWGLRNRVDEQWVIIDGLLRRRVDLIPNIYETVRRVLPGEEAMMKPMIEQRLVAVKDRCVCGGKVEAEHDLSMMLREVMDLGRVHRELGSDTNFLELRKDLVDLEKEIEIDSGNFNRMVRAYNKDRRNLLLRPLAAVFRLQEKMIFEFEEHRKLK